MESQGLFGPSTEDESNTNSDDKHEGECSASKDDCHIISEIFRRERRPKMRWQRRLDKWR